MTRMRSKRLTAAVVALTVFTAVFTTVKLADSSAGQREPITDDGVAALTLCEATYDYTIVDSGIDRNTGQYYAFYGAWQFEWETWNEMLTAMTRAGYGGIDWEQFSAYHLNGELVNTPNVWPAHIQDHVGAWTWANDYIGPPRWPVCQHRAFAAMQANPGQGLTLVSFEQIKAETGQITQPTVESPEQKFTG